MSPLDWFKKERPMLSMQSFGGGAAGLMISGAPPAIDASGGVVLVMDTFIIFLVLVVLQLFP